MGEQHTLDQSPPMAEYPMMFFLYVCIQMDEVRMCIDIECSASFAHWKLATT